MEPMSIPPPPPSGPPPPPPSNPPGYQPYGGYGGGPRRDHPKGTTVLVFGILSLVCCGLFGPFAWAQGNTALREIDSTPNVYGNRGTVNAGRICGIIGSVFLVIQIIYVIVVFVIAGS
jgi:hypothetical protein